VHQNAAPLPQVMPVQIFDSVGVEGTKIGSLEFADEIKRRSTLVDLFFFDEEEPVSESHTLRFRDVIGVCRFEFWGIGRSGGTFGGDEATAVEDVATSAEALLNAGDDGDVGKVSCKDFVKHFSIALPEVLTIL